MPSKKRQVSRKRSPAPAARVATTTHRHSDVAGILLLSLAALLTVGLVAGKTGVLGESLSEALRSFLGRGSFLGPILLASLGVSALRRNSIIDPGQIAWGGCLIVAAILGGLAKARNGDFFDPTVVVAGGGYVGAVVGWATHTLLGNAWWVGIGAIGLIGFVVASNKPIHEVLSSMRRPRPVVTPREMMVEDKETKTLVARDKKSALREALVRMQQEPVARAEKEEDSDPLATRVPPGRAKPKPVLRDTQQMETIQLETASSKEGYELPPMTLLREPATRVIRPAEEMQVNISTLERTLEEFGIEANVVEIATGPTITRYEVQLGPGIRVGRITALADNIAMSLAASHVRVEAPIPGKNAIGVEVPNSKSAVVTLRELSETKQFMDEPRRLIVGLGQDVSGQNRYTDLTKMPHLLIGGATNSGKSIGLATIITSLLMRNTPKDLRFVMIDPKRVELSLFDGIPHLMCPVVKDVKEAPGVLRAVWREMDIRYDLLSERGVRNIDGWNEKASFAERLPYIVVVIDELADLMIQASAEVETSIVRLAQLARAVGIHLVIATQRPSVDVITGLIKANIPSRMAFAVSSQIDSRTILDQGGAEKLVGKGDMLFLPIDATKPTRIQGCYVSEKEIEDICNHWKAQEKPHYVLNPIAVAIADKERQIAEEDTDALWEDTVRWVVERGQASTSMIQRKFSIGFQRASRLLDMMEERGIVGPRDGPRPREVLLDPMDVETVLGGGIPYSGPPIEMDPFDDEPTVGS